MKPSSAREVILEEYADGIHFITSLLIAKGTSADIEIADNIKLLSKREITESFLQLFSYVDKLDNPKKINE
ncbi:hypothetical protein FACS1894166_10310 [Bacilli bacterium]|nr:hypothetical protein FACS1894166_10310 [Bacilli bacterium]